MADVKTPQTDTEKKAQQAVEKPQAGTTGFRTVTETITEENKMRELLRKAREEEELEQEENEKRLKKTGGTGFKTKNAASGDNADGKPGFGLVDENNDDDDAFGLGRWAKIIRRLHGVVRKNGYFNIHPDKRGQISDAQLRYVLIGLILEDKASNIRFYRGKNIDPQLTQRATLMMEQMKQSGHIFDVTNKNNPKSEQYKKISINQTAYEGLTPWQEQSPLRRYHAGKLAVKKTVGNTVTGARSIASMAPVIGRPFETAEQKADRKGAKGEDKVGKQYTNKKGKKANEHTHKGGTTGKQKEEVLKAKKKEKQAKKAASKTPSKAERKLMEQYKNTKGQDPLEQGKVFNETAAPATQSEKTQKPDLAKKFDHLAEGATTTTTGTPQAASEDAPASKKTNASGAPIDRASV